MPISIYLLLGNCPSLYVTIPPSDLHQHIGGLLESQVITDFTFLVSKETLPEIGSMPSVRTFAECFLSGTRKTSYLPSATLDIILHTATIQFAECQTLGEIKHSAYVQFAECPASDTRQNLTGVTPLNVCRVSRGDTRQT
jgi:hypothetical protein